MARPAFHDRQLEAAFGDDPAEVENTAIRQRIHTRERCWITREPEDFRIAGACGHLVDLAERPFTCGNPVPGAVDGGGIHERRRLLLLQSLPIPGGLLVRW